MVFLQSMCRRDPKIWDFIEENGQAGMLKDSKFMDALFELLPYPVLDEDIVFWGQLVDLRATEETQHRFDEARSHWISSPGYEGEICSLTSTSASLIICFFFSK
jgi:hypothetical protein